MAKLKAHGEEITRFFSPSKRSLMAVMSDGVTLKRNLYSGWKVAATKKSDVSLETWKRGKLEKITQVIPQWARNVEHIPSLATLQAWEADGICETPTGYRVEPDGHGPDGSPSWLLALGII